MSALQEQFAQDAAKLIQYAATLTYGVTFGEAWRSQATADANAAAGRGISNSLHIQRLAIDLNLFLNGVYQTDDSQGCYSALGDYWKAISSNHYWGGDFTSKDYNHYSISPDGGRTR